MLYIRYASIKSSLLFKKLGRLHLYGIVWDPLDLRYSEQSVFFINTDIEGKQKPPFQKKHYFVANHIRAVLDLLSSDQLILAQGMRRNFKF